jgi:hypothetical protein
MITSIEGTVELFFPIAMWDRLPACQPSVHKSIKSFCIPSALSGGPQARHTENHNWNLSRLATLLQFVFRPIYPYDACFSKL